ncbi:hypothetical protein [Flexivirga meconopsidis]|uniref:hypothetical protein n=1 Tax=Flexivirga meconopsidis TaxID=2977121 RepID=UPI0022400D99|nr:hypothetical protein [Flexivirga meconopsidis]
MQHDAVDRLSSSVGRNSHINGIWPETVQSCGNERSGAVESRFGPDLPHRVPQEAFPGRRPTSDHDGVSAGEEPPPRRDLIAHGESINSVQGQGFPMHHPAALKREFRRDDSPLMRIWPGGDSEVSGAAR